MQDRDSSLDMIPSLPEVVRLARGSAPPTSRRIECPTLRLDPKMLAHLRSQSSDIPSLTSARNVRMIDPDDDRHEPTRIVDLDDVRDSYAEITIVS